MNDKLDIFKILNENNNDNQQEILTLKNETPKQNQEHHYAPDFDLFDALFEESNSSIDVRKAVSESAAAHAPAKPTVQKPAPSAPAKSAVPKTTVQKPAPSAPAKPTVQKPAPPKPAPPAPAKLVSSEPAPAKPAPVVPQPVHEQELRSVTFDEESGRTKASKHSGRKHSGEHHHSADSRSEHRYRTSRPQPVPRPDRPPRKRRIFWNIIKAIVLIMALTLFMTFVVGIQKINSDYMAPMINNGDYVVIKKTVKSYHEGDIIIFRDGHGQKCISRIAASGGDVVDIKKKDGLYINNKLDESSHAIGKTRVTDGNVTYPILVSESEFFVLGDNRENSVDSRNHQISTIEQQQIMGKVIYCFKKIN